MSGLFSPWHIQNYILFMSWVYVFSVYEFGHLVLWNPLASRMVSLFVVVQWLGWSAVDLKVVFQAWTDLLLLDPRAKPTLSITPSFQGRVLEDKPFIPLVVSKCICVMAIKLSNFHWYLGCDRRKNQTTLEAARRYQKTCLLACDNGVCFCGIGCDLGLLSIRLDVCFMTCLEDIFWAN